MADVTHPELVKTLVKNPIDIMSTLSITGIDLWHGATGVAGECGELLEGILRTSMFPNSDELEAGRVNLLEESGDIYFYTEQLVQREKLELDWDSVMAYAGRQHLGPDRMLYHAMHVAIFGSQVLDTVKKTAIYNKPLDTTMLRSQLTEMLKHVATLGLMFGISREQALEANIEKLGKRYEGLKYTDKAAQQRLDKPPERRYIGKPENTDIPTE